MSHDENDVKAADIISFAQVKALIKVYGYIPIPLGPIEDVHADRIIEEGLEGNKKLEEIVKESGRSLSTVKRRKDEYLGIKNKNSDK